MWCLVPAFFLSPEQSDSSHKDSKETYSIKASSLYMLANTTLKPEGSFQRRAASVDSIYLLQRNDIYRLPIFIYRGKFL